MSTDTLTIYRCAECGRCFGSETAILDHQSLWTRLHAFDPEIAEHDGAPWSVKTLATGDYFDYSGRVSTFVRMRPSELAGDDPADREIVYLRGLNRTEWVGNFNEIVVPRVDEQLVRAWATAAKLGLSEERTCNEVSLEWYARWLTDRWHDDPSRLAEERHLMLAQIAITQRSNP